MLFRQLFDAESSTYTYLLADEASKEAVLIDPVLEQVDRDIGLLNDLQLKLVYALDTHVHADHVTGCGTLRARLGAQTVLSERAGTGYPDILVKQGDKLHFGRYWLEVRETPGHTNGCISYVTGDHKKVFTGDALLIRGSGRTDFQQGDARTLYQSVHGQIFSLPPETEIYPGHDYKGRTVTTVEEEMRLNPRLGGGKTVEDFVAIMGALQLAYPKKIDIALPANLACGVPRGISATVEPPQVRPWAPVEVTTSGIPEVAPEWVAAYAGLGRFIDVREPDEFIGELGHVPGSTLVPLKTLPAVAVDWDRQEPLVLICRSGGRSGKAALELQSMGFGAVVSMRGGMTAWNRLGFTVQRSV